MLPRADPRDAFVSLRHASLDALPQGARMGTSSLRRQCQLNALRPDLEIAALRGTVDTRLRKLRDGDYDAIVLAAAGLIRLGLGDRITHYIETDRSLPAVGQGIVGVECRCDDARSIELAAALDDTEARHCCEAERAFAQRLQGSCQSPIGGFARIKGDRVELSGLVGSADGRTIYRGSIDGPVSQRRQLGVTLAERLLAQGAARLLAELGTRQ
jgi:hydroxymethylbilane synthase